MALAKAICPVLIGREHELTSLEDALLEAARGAGRVVLLEGDAGMGKTRLARELADNAGRIGMVTLAGRCSEAELALPYLPFLEALGNYLASADVEEIKSGLGPTAGDLANVFPKLGAARGPEVADSAQSKLRLFEGVLELLRLAARDRGLLLVLEDLHWADASTRELIDYLTRRLGGLRILVLGTYRGDELNRRHPLRPLIQGWQRAGIEVITLAALPPAAVARMVDEIFGGTTQPQTRDFLHERSEGNPFVLEEMLKEAIDRGDIFRDRGHWNRKELSEFRVPETVADSILMRVERLDQNEVDVLKAAAVLGASFTDATLVDMLGGEEERVQEALRNCVQQQLLEEGGNRGSFRFRHALTREAIYNDLVTTQRQRLHSRAADALARQQASAVDLCHHLFEAKRWQEAVPLALKAATEAERAFANGEAATLYERTLPFVDEPVERGRILCRLGTAKWLCGEPTAGAAYLEEGVGLLEKSDQVREAARHRLTLGRCYWENRKRTLAIDQYERARRALEPLGPTEELSLAYMRLAATHVFGLDGLQAKEMAELGIKTAIEANAEAARVWNQVFHASALTELDDPEAGLELLDRTREEALRLGEYYIAANATLNVTGQRIAMLRGKENEAVFEWLRQVPGVPEAYVQTRRGEAMLGIGRLKLAEPLLRSGSAGAKAGGVLSLQAAADHALGWALVEMDRMEEARQLAQRHVGELDRQDLEFQTQLRMRVGIDSGDLDLALRETLDQADLPGFMREVRAELIVEVFLAAGRVEQAEIAGRVPDTGLVGARPFRRRMEGRLALAKGDHEAAIERLTEAADIWQKAEYLTEESRTRRVLADAYIARGDQVAAEQQLRRVLDLARESGASFEARKANEKLSELGFVAAEPAIAVPLDTDGPIGERLVTIMFADVRGYTGMTQDAAPADMKDRIAAFQRWAAREVERNHGVVDKFAGDAVMATFNVSGASVDHAEDAVRAAIGLRDRAAYAGLPIGVGIATGPAIVGRLADGANMSVLGDATNLASRLQARAAAGEIIVSDETFRRLRGRFEADTEQVRLKGIRGAITTHRVRSAAVQGRAG